MWFGAELRRQAGAKGFDLIVRQSRRLAVKTDKPRDSGNLQDFQAVAQRKPHKDVTRKKRHLQFHAPILPAAHAVIERQKMLNGPFEKLLRHTLFVVRAGVGNVPAGLHKLDRQLRSFQIALFRNAWQYHRGSPQDRRIQLRPVSHTAEINITLSTTTTYSYFDRDSADFSASSRGTASPKSSSVPECCFHPFFDAQGRYAFEA